MCYWSFQWFPRRKHQEANHADKDTNYKLEKERRSREEREE